MLYIKVSCASCCFALSVDFWPFMIPFPPEQASAIHEHNYFDNIALIVTVHMRDKTSCHIVKSLPTVLSMEGERKVTPLRGAHL